MPKVEIIYATIEEQEIITLDIEDNANIQRCIEHSGILRRYPEIDLSTMKVGVFSQVKPLTEIVKDGDRIEIYRSLIADPKVVRRKKAENDKN